MDISPKVVSVSDILRNQQRNVSIMRNTDSNGGSGIDNNDVRLSPKSYGLGNWKEYASRKYGDSSDYQNSSNGKKIIESAAVMKAKSEMLKLKNWADVVESKCLLAINQMEEYEKREQLNLKKIAMLEDYLKSSNKKLFSEYKLHFDNHEDAPLSELNKSNMHLHTTPGRESTRHYRMSIGQCADRYQTNDRSCGGVVGLSEKKSVINNKSVVQKEQEKSSKKVQLQPQVSTALKVIEIPIVHPVRPENHSLTRKSLRVDLSSPEKPLPPRLVSPEHAPVERFLPRAVGSKNFSDVSEDESEDDYGEVTEIFSPDEVRKEEIAKIISADQIYDDAKDDVLPTFEAPTGGNEIDWNTSFSDWNGDVHHSEIQQSGDENISFESNFADFDNSFGDVGNESQTNKNPFAEQFDFASFSNGSDFNPFDEINKHGA